MSITADDLGVLGNLATAIGLLDADGDPNPAWFGDPAESLSTILADEHQREALIGFVDEAMGGADRETDAGGATWLPIVTLEDPSLTVAITIDDAPTNHVVIGLGVTFSTTSPASRSSAAVPLFKAAKRGKSVPTPFVLGQPGGRLRFDTRITVDASAPVPGQPRLGAVGLEADLPTSPSDPADASFGLVLEDFQLPGASAPQTLRVSASNAGELDDAILDLVLSLVRAQAEAVGGTALGALAGLLGLGADAVDDFPIEQLVAQGPRALGTWLEGILAAPAARQAWLGHVATLVGGTRVGDEVTVSLGAVNAALRFGLRTEAGPSGHLRLTATLGADVGATSPRVQARADAFRIDLGTGEALALPSVGLWASIGRHDGSGTRVLDVSAPTVARADRLRVGFGLDPARRLTFVLAADVVRLGTRDYPTLDLTSPDAVMDAAGNALEDVANELLGQLGAALAGVKLLLGIDPPPGHPTVPTIGLAELLGDPLGAVSGYWRTLLTAHGDAVPALLEVVRDAIGDAGAAAGPIRGTGSAADPWRIPLVGPVELEAQIDGDALAVAVAAGTRVDTLGQRCTVIETRLAATIAVIDLAAGSAQLLPSVDGRLTARERGVSPPRAALPLADGVVLTADHVGVRLSWGAGPGLSAHFEAPSLSLQLGGDAIPVALPVVAADGSVTFPAAGWDALQALVGHIGALLPGFAADVVQLLGWGAGGPRTPVLRLADLVADPAAALAAWLPEVLMSKVGPAALGTLADLLTAAGPVSGAFTGTGHPDDPYRLALDLAPGVPELVVWFPPDGLEPRLVAAPQALQRWRPGDDPLPPEALAAAIQAEAGVSAELRDLAHGRDIAGGLAELVARWTASDGRIVPPASAPAGVDVVRIGVAAGQLLGRLDLEDQLGRVPTTVVYAALGPGAWPAAPADRRLDLTTPGLAPAMFTAPAAAAGDWFVALGERAACRLAAGDDDGTVGQAARLRRVLDALAPLGNDLVLVGLGGAGHAARLAAQEQPTFSDVVTLGTPLGPVSLTALGTQPTADALRLLDRLLPAPTGAGEDDDLALGRNLVAAMLELADRADPSSELRPPATALPAPRVGLTTTAIFGDVDADRVGRAITAVVAAGLATRARARAATPLPEPTGVRFGVRLAVPPTTAGSLVVEGDALVTLAGWDRVGGITTARELRVRSTVRDRLGWLASTPELALRMVTADVVVPLGGGAGPGHTTITLHDARAFGVDRERLVLGTTAEAVPLLPEARVLIGTAVERLVADVTNPVAAGLVALLEQLGLVSAGGSVPNAFEQLIHDPAGLVNGRLAAATSAIAGVLGGLLGPAGATVDLPARTIAITGGSPSTGKFGWSGQLTVGPSGLSSGGLTVGPPGPFGAAGGLQLALELVPFAAALRWHRPSGAVDEIALWPNPEPGAIARALAEAGPSLGAHLSLELMRRADEDARPVIEAVLDAAGMLGGAPGDEDRPLRPLAGLIADPAGWFRSGDSIASQPAKAQALFDALRPLTGLGGNPGEPLPLANGVSLSVQAAGPDLRLELGVDSGGWTPVATPVGRLAGGLTAALTIPASGPPAAGLALHAGLAGATPGRQAVHVGLGATGITVFVRPSAGADIPLIPFAGLGALAAAAERALPFLLDRLAELPAPVGPAVAGIGDALALRTGTPKSFGGEALAAWAADPVAALANAVPSIVSTGLTTLAPLVDAVVPGNVTVTATATDLTATVGAVSIGWSPTQARVTVSGAGIDVPGIEELSFTVAISDAGLDELSLTVGPAAIDAGVTLRPFVTVAAGSSPAGGRRVAVGLALDDTHRFGARWLLDTSAFSLVASNGSIAAPSDVSDPVAVALRAVEAVADLVAAVALGTQAVQDLLDMPVGGDQVRDLLRGVLLEDTANPSDVIGGLFDPATVLDRVQRLFENVAAAGLSVTVEGLTISLLEDDGTIGVQLGLAQRLELVSGDVNLWLENDDSWIEDNPPGSGGLFVGMLSTGGTLQFEPSLTVNGVGLRVGKTSGPLLDFGVSLESIAFHTFARLGLTGAKAGGLQLQFSNLAVSASGASGGNSIASGLLKDSGSQPPKPAFSPALAIQKHGNDPVHVTLRAGEGEGPWWIAIQKGFGPLYLEQVGLGVTMPQQRVERISLLMDGSVSLFGLTCAVDDLQITYLVSRGDFFNPTNWEVDLAGLAVSADMAGLVIQGGLLKSGQPPNVEYLGMLLARFAVYGITIYGGYGEGGPANDRFVAFFAVGAISGPIGGPPAFFLTGIGGGFGINRALVVPTDLSQFGQYPLIKALDVAAKPGNPMDELRSLGAFFPMERGTFWFAAGLSFNSFALVDGIAVVAVEVGDGLDISLLGLARMALPRPQVAIVSIEIALLVRFSSSEGVLWVQGQLTDNSWLLYPDVRLTGGFAFVTWFKGEYRGQFVLTLGGYHPDFNKPGYPQVPRLGLRWGIGDAIVIKAGSYFALTSEAVMAGGDFEASAEFGPAWAEVKFGAHGIVYFDPFRYKVLVYARIAAGVTIDTWLFGEITISVSLGARIEVEGPDFHGKATFEVGPIDLTVEFGSSEQTRKELLAAGPFIDKYLEAGPSGGARAITVITSSGAQPSGGAIPTPDGGADRPYVVVCEFSLVLTSTVPATDVVLKRPAGDDAPKHFTPTRSLGVAPMGTGSVAPTIELSWFRSNAKHNFPFAVTGRRFGAFPIGVWGPPQDDNDRKTPKGDIVEALSELDLVASATESPGGPEIPYYQVEIGPRKPLPFTRRAIDATRIRDAGTALSGLVPEPASVDAAFATAGRWLAESTSPTGLAALRGERQAPPRFGTLGEGLDAAAASEIPEIGARPAPRETDAFVYPPVAVGVLSAAGLADSARPPRGTTVEGSGRMWRTPSPTMAAVELSRSRSIAAQLILLEPDAARSRATRTVVATGEVPTTAVAREAPAAVGNRGGEGRDRLLGLTASLAAGRRVAAAAGTPAAQLAAGEIAVLRLPNAARDVGDAERPQLGLRGSSAARLVALANGGDVIADLDLGGPADRVAAWTVPAGTERLAVIALGDGAERESGLAGWHAAMQLPYVGWSTALGARCTVRSFGGAIPQHRERGAAGWVAGAELTQGLSTVSTRFSLPVTTVLVVLDDPEALGGSVDGRRLALGLDGATRATDAGGGERPPIVLTAESRSVLAYDVVPSAEGRPIVVTVATEQGWSLAGVLGAVGASAQSAIASIAERGLDASLRPIVPGQGGGLRLEWLGERPPSRAARRQARTPKPTRSRKRER